MTVEDKPGVGHGFPAAGTNAPTFLTQQSSSAEKITLFRSLFRGREDVYPRRFESRKTGRAGYQPACGNEWVRGVCEKPRVKWIRFCGHLRIERDTAVFPVTCTGQVLNQLP